MTKQPRDDAGVAIPVLRFRAGGSQALTVSGSSQRSSEVRRGTRVVTVTATQPVFFRSGDASVTASLSDHYLVSSIPYDIALGSDISSDTGYHTHLAFIAVSAEAQVYISERE
jgi:hypothetical protein